MASLSGSSTHKGKIAHNLYIVFKRRSAVEADEALETTLLFTDANGTEPSWKHFNRQQGRLQGKRRSGGMSRSHPKKRHTRCYC
jgi:hypothetical protein